MSGIWGKNIRYSIFGESHGAGVGMVLDGLPPGLALDMEEIYSEMDRRRPGKAHWSTPRNEKDEFEILSGYFNHKTTGAPLCIFIRNNNQSSKDYEATKNIMRPGHGDYTGYIKYEGFNDYRGGGHFSGRLTAALVFAGAVAKQILRQKNIIIGSHILQIGNVFDHSFHSMCVQEKLLKDLSQKDFAVLDEEKAIHMQRVITEARETKDSIGGVIEAAVINLPVGLGKPFFDSVESTLAHLMFSIPAVKGLEFGSGFKLAQMKGSEAKDEFYMDHGMIKTSTNHNGGILGGITTGMPLIFRVAFKPTPSIGQPQRTIDMSKMENTEIEIKGRHDPCIVPRAVAVVEATAAMGILDLLMDELKRGDKDD